MNPNEKEGFYLKERTFMKRIEWIDSLKGFGIFCVTLGHQGCNFLIEKHIYSFHMFLFFFLSGFLHSNYDGNFKIFITKKTKALFLPFMFWNIASFFAGLLLNEPIVESVREFFVLDGVICWNAPIWFLLSLYMTEILFFVIEKFIPYGKYIFIPVLLLLWLLVSDRSVFLMLNVLPISLLFYIFGNIFRHYCDAHPDAVGKAIKYSIPAAVLLLVLNIVFGVFLNERIAFTGADFGNIIYCNLAAVSGVFFYITLFRRFRFLRVSKVLSYLGKNSLIIMATQYWFFKLYDAISEPLIGVGIWHFRNTAKAFIVAIITILLICAIVELLKKLSAKSTIIKKICVLVGINMA